MAAQYTRRGQLCPFFEEMAIRRIKDNATVYFESERFFPVSMLCHSHENNSKDGRRAEQVHDMNICSAERRHTGINEPRRQLFDANAEQNPIWQSGYKIRISLESGPVIMS